MTQVQRLDVEDQLEVARVSGVRPHEALKRCNETPLYKTTTTTTQHLAFSRKHYRFLLDLGLANEEAHVTHSSLM